MAEKSSGERLLPDTDRHVENVVSAACDELRVLIRQRADITKRIGTIKQTLAGLANLFGDGILNDELLDLIGRKTDRPGFTRCCRTILMEAGRPLSARDVHKQIQMHEPMLLERHKDPLVSVTTVLNRLAEYGEARTVFLNGRRAWVWMSEIREDALNP